MISLMELYDTYYLNAYTIIKYKSNSFIALTYIIAFILFTDSREYVNSRGERVLQCIGIQYSRINI